jgi:hypothetical protein
MYRLLLFCFLIINIPLQALGDKNPVEDTTQVLLLEDINIQLEATQAINDMYNFEFAKAEMQFRWIKQKYPDHPLSYFLLALSDWWKININITNTQYDERFLAYLDTAIAKSKILYKQPQSLVEAAFFLAAGYGFKGRLYAERGKWAKSVSAGKSSLKYLDDSKGKGYLSPELLFGDGLYNYFSVWIRENYPYLKPLMVFFKKGDKELGIEQLRTVANYAFYTRTEAQYFLMRILQLENQPAAAMQISEYLYKTFPNNSYFHRYYARMLYSTGQMRGTEIVSLEILARIDSGQIGYEEVSGRYAAFYLGEISKQKRDLKDAKYYYHRTVDFAEATGSVNSGYYLYSMLSLGEIALKEGGEDLARKYFKRIKKEAKRKDSVHKRARILLKEM